MPKNIDSIIGQDAQNTAKVLAEALPYMRQFAGETFVIKYGGSTMGNPELAKAFAKDVVMLKQVGINPVIVHGGGPQITKMLEKLKIKNNFIDGLRVTTKETVDVVEMVLSGIINKDIVSNINNAGGTAIGLSGKDGDMIQARKVRRTVKDPTSNIEQILDLGFVGEPETINPDILLSFEESDIIPVIAPIGYGANGETYNINADTVAGAMASALTAAKLLLLTDVPGVLDAKNELINEITASKLRQLIFDKTIDGGMIPKVETCINAIENNTAAAHILDGRIPHVLLLEIFTAHGTGTMIY